MEYPDRWVVLQINDRKHVLAGYIGGYLGSDSWRRSSPIQFFEKTEDAIIATTRSGNQYHLNTGREGFTNLTSDIYAQMEEAFKENNISLSIVKGQDISLT
jgi:hypothetical protein